MCYLSQTSDKRIPSNNKFQFKNWLEMNDALCKRWCCKNGIYGALVQ